MRLLLDTHALLWWLDGDPKLSGDAKAAIGDGANEILISAASAWEIATKVRIGKLPGAGYVAEHLPEVIADQGFRSLPIAVVHARRVGVMAGTHRDPFDRMLIAQALMERLILVSNEIIFDSFGVERLWLDHG